MNSSFFDDGELLVRASAVLKSQGPENGARGRPGKFQFFFVDASFPKKSYYEKTRPRPGCCGERRSAARALRKRFFLKPKSDGYASLLGVLPLFCFVGCYPATRGRAFREWPLSGPGSGRWAEFLGGLTALKIAFVKPALVISTRSRLPVLGREYHLRRRPLRSPPPFV